MKELFIYLDTRQTWHLQVKDSDYKEFVEALEKRKNIYIFILDNEDVVISLDKIVSIKVTDV